MLQQKFHEDLKQAMKQKDELRVSVLRMLIAAIRNKEISLIKKEEGLSDDEVLQVVRGEVKRRKEASAEFDKGGRVEMAEKEKAEAKILARYLPTELSDEELQSAVISVIKQVGAVSESDFGLVMKTLIPTLKGRVSGERVSHAVRETLRAHSL
jgi:uncharacterized protein